MLLSNLRSQWQIHTINHRFNSCWNRTSIAPLLFWLVHWISSCQQPFEKVFQTFFFGFHVCFPGCTHTQEYAHYRILNTYAVCSWLRQGGGPSENHQHELNFRPVAARHEPKTSVALPLLVPLTLLGHFLCCAKHEWNLETGNRSYLSNETSHEILPRNPVRSKQGNNPRNSTPTARDASPPQGVTKGFQKKQDCKDPWSHSKQLSKQGIRVIFHNPTQDLGWRHIF